MATKKKTDTENLEQNVQTENLTAETKTTNTTEKTVDLNSPSEIRKRAYALVRFKLVCNNTVRMQAKTATFSILNDVMGSLTRVIPLEQKWYEDGYHVERCILDLIKAKKYSAKVQTKDSKGNDITQLQTVPEYTVTELEPLSPEEFEALKLKQKTTGSIDIE